MERTNPRRALFFVLHALERAEAVVPVVVVGGLELVVTVRADHPDRRW
jgi:hypothetical protein